MSEGLRDRLATIIAQSIADEFGWESTEAIIHTSTIQLIAKRAATNLVAAGVVLPTDPPADAITRVPLTIVSTLDGACTDGVLVGVLAADLDRFEERAARSVATPPTGPTRDNVEAFPLSPEDVDDLLTWGAVYSMELRKTLGQDLGPQMSTLRDRLREIAAGAVGVPQPEERHEAD